MLNLLNSVFVSDCDLILINKILLYRDRIDTNAQESRISLPKFPQLAISHLSLAFG